MKCCRSCVFWDKASKKIPINAVRVIDEKVKLAFEYEGKLIELPGWKWIVKEPDKLSKIKYLRFCFYGKGLVLAWDICENYTPKHAGKVECEIGECEFSDVCPKFRSKLFYIA